ncbi:MAG: NTP transferase domain-containing protein [Prevotella sp.]|nr:NTP transferase domain-containing protein [Prevotella sp.]
MNNYCIILAGGKGKRLWPCSREDCPKQFLDFFSTGKTLLQKTYDRIVRFLPPENIYVTTNKAYTHYVTWQLPELPSDNILSEPIFRDTAPSAAWAVYRILHVNPDARVIVMPSDQAVFKEDVFINNLQEGLEFVGKNDCILAMGVKPTRPEPGYGYVQIGDLTDQGNVFKVKSFTEKPDRKFAEMFMNSGEFYWNTGIFLSNVRYLRASLLKILPSILRNVETTEETPYNIEKELKFIDDNYPSFPNISIDHGIFDKSDNVYVMKCDFGWADLGMWHSIYENISKGEGDNVVIGSQVILEDSKNNIIKLPNDHMGIINGLDGYIVAEKGNVLLICRKEDSSALIRKYINEVQVKYGDEFI